jgi:hypothetical protein
LKTAAAIACLVLALVFGYVFLANFEYPGVTTGKLVSGSAAACFLTGALVLALKKRDRA